MLLGVEVKTKQIVQEVSQVYRNRFLPAVAQQNRAFVNSTVVAWLGEEWEKAATREKYA